MKIFFQEKKKILILSPFISTVKVIRVGCLYEVLMSFSAICPDFDTLYICDLLYLCTFV